MKLLWTCAQARKETLYVIPEKLPMLSYGAFKKYVDHFLHYIPI